MISLNSENTVKILIEKLPNLKDEWENRDVFQPLKFQNRHHYFYDVDHDIKFKDTGFKVEENLNLLFAHFPLLKYEMEAVEMPLYASKVFPNSNIDSWYFDSRGNLSPQKKGYLARSREGKKTSPQESFLERYDLMVTRSSTISRMRSEVPKVLNSCGFKVNVQTNNHTGCMGIGEDYAFCYTDFFAPAGRKFTDRSQSLASSKDFKKNKIIAFIGSVVWWKGQAEWFENIDPDLLSEYTVVVFGPKKEERYFNRMISAARRKDIDVLYSDYVHPDFLCDILTYSEVSIMNPFMEPPWQLALGPARTVGESVACNNICLHGTSADKNGLNGKTMSIPKEWSEYVLEFDNTDLNSYNESLSRALSLDRSKIDFSNQITFEEKCDQIFQKCLEEMHKT